MPFQEGFKFPTDEELTCEEVNLSYSTLKAGALHLGKYCNDVNNEFMLCREEEGDPRKCLKEGKAVTSCSLEFFRKIKANCFDEFNQYAKCLYMSSGDFKFKWCRKTQAAFDQCMVDKLNLERPYVGWQSEVKVHHTNRPKPPKEIDHYPDAPDPFPYEKGQEYPPPRLGSRNRYT